MAVMAWGYLDQRRADGDARFDPDYGSHDAASALNQLLARAAPGDAAAIERRAICDLPARALLEASSGADLLVVGARGYGGFRGLLLGSVSQQCAHHTTIPMAIVRRGDRRLAGTSDKIVVGIDGSATSLQALAWALDEGRARRATVTVVHAWRPAVLGAFEYAAPVLGVETLEAAAKQTVDDALAASRVDGLPVPVNTEIVDGGAAGAILDAAADASLVVVGSRGRGGFSGLLMGSVSQHVIHHATCPVIVVPQ